MADKITKLSQAIRLGATFRPQCRNAYYKQGYDKVLMSCALGAAAEAIGGEPNFSDPCSAIAERFPTIDPTGRIFGRIAAANDSGQTREEIAKWLEKEGL